MDVYLQLGYEITRLAPCYPLTLLFLCFSKEEPSQALLPGHVRITHQHFKHGADEVGEALGIAGYGSVYEARVRTRRVEEIRDSDIGTRAGLFEVLKLGDEFFTFIVDCEEPKACTILLRGASKDVLNEVSFAFLTLPARVNQGVA